MDRRTLTGDRRSIIATTRKILSPSFGKKDQDFSPVLEAEIDKYKDQIQTFDEDSRSLLKSIDRYAEAAKLLLEAERSLANDLRKLITEENNSIYGPMKPHVSTLVDDFETEISATSPFLEMLSTYTKTAKKKVEKSTNNFKKRISEESDREVLNEDLSAWWEQKREIFDPCLIMVMKERAHRQPVPMEIVNTISKSAQNSDPFETEEEDFSFQRVFRDPVGSLYLRQFLEEEYSIENLEFVEQVEKLRELSDQTEIKKKIESIEWNFLREGSQHQINLSSEAKKKINTQKIASQTLSNRIFDQAVVEILHLIQDDSFPRFKKSNTYDRMKKRFSKSKRLPNYCLSPIEERHTLAWDSPNRRHTLFQQEKEEAVRKRSNTLQGIINRMSSPSKSPDNRSATLVNGEMLFRGTKDVK
eukprot:TRINITY_DN1912_c0_g1_i1.p1 TRINITY_DN1912_c0_g1~~TRINITY_DN1912_c0_g1_i1.p1  ORF type:complete len:416 (-),score=154.61 TRINITY_DN1912_c0_g1_i1:37-1284(-)